MKSLCGSQKWIGSNCFTFCTSCFSRNRLFPLVCSLKDCMAYLHYKWKTIMAVTVSKVSFSLFPRGKRETGTRKFHCDVLHNGDDDWLFMVCEVSRASYRPVGDSGRMQGYLERSVIAVEHFRWNPKTFFSCSMGWTSSARQKVPEAVVNVEQFWKYHRSDLQSDSENISLIIFWMIICSVLGVLISSENNLKLKKLRVSSWNRLSGMNIVFGIYWCHKRRFHYLGTYNYIACYTGTGSFSPNE